MNLYIISSAKSVWVLFPGLPQVHGEVFYRRILFVEEPRAKVGGSTAVDHRAAHNVWSLLEGEAFGHAVIDDRLAITVYADDFLAVDPPDGGCIRADRQAHVLQFVGAVHNGDGPEQHVGRWLAQRIGEVIQVDIV